MDINKVYEEIDALSRMGRSEDIKDKLNMFLREAEQEGDIAAVLTILNELIGIYREFCNHEEALSCGSAAMKVIKDANLVGTVHHATTMLNIANALRAAGHYEDSLSTYQQVEAIYKNILKPNDPYYASLYNNESLLYQEMGRYKDAYDRLESALEIVISTPGKEWEVAVTHTNLANTLIEMAVHNKEAGDQKECEEDYKEAFDYVEKAIKAFEAMNADGAHMAAALVAKGRILEHHMDYHAAVNVYQNALDLVYKKFGKTDEYDRIREYLNHAIASLDALDFMYDSVNDFSAVQRITTDLVEPKKPPVVKGMDICKSYYEECGYPAFKEKYPEYIDKMAFGLVGEGSDCFGYDDEYSMDHDWGPGFCVWVDDDTFAKVGAELQKVYDELPKEYKGYRRYSMLSGAERVGVHRISDFYGHFIGPSAWKEWEMYEHISSNTLMWIDEYQLAAATNGQVWSDNLGLFSKIRDDISRYYDESGFLLKLAQLSAQFSQNLQYNYSRSKQRGERVTVSFVLNDGLQVALKLGYLLNRAYAPHEKWLFRGTEKFTVVPRVREYVERITEADQVDRNENTNTTDILIEELSLYLLTEMVAKGYVGDLRLADMGDNKLVADLFLEHYSNEMVLRAEFAEQSKDELVGTIVQTEFAAFDEVKNEGGRAGCQDDFDTFNIMRSSQYNTWTKPMLVQYATDFQLSFDSGWNMITEKYGRMEERTDPDAWDKIKDSFPVIPDGKKAIINEIVSIQVKWMEEFAAEYPGLAKNARRIHSSEDKPWDTSYETYLYGELSTYSDKMLKLYGEFVVGLSKAGENLAYKIMKETIHYYGYNSFEEAMENV